jgi:hypothetical protein
VEGGINYNSSDAEQLESNSLWADYESKLSPEKEIFSVVFYGQIIPSPTTVVFQVESETRILSVPRILNLHY